MSSGGGTTILTLTGAALIAASVGLGYMTYTSSSSTNKSYDGIRDIEDEDDEDFITEEEVVQIFDQIFLAAQNKTAEIMGQIQKMKMIGQSVPEAQIQMFMRQELEQAITNTQSLLTGQAGIDEDCLEEAVWEFVEKESTKVKNAVDRLQRLWQTTTGESVVGWRPGVVQAEEEILGPEETIEAAKVYYQALTAAIRSIVIAYKKAGKDLSNPAVQQQLNLEITQNGSPAAEASLRKIGVTQNQFEASVKANGGSPQVAQALAMLHAQQSRDLQGIGM